MVQGEIELLKTLGVTRFQEGYILVSREIDQELLTFDPEDQLLFKNIDDIIEAWNPEGENCNGHISSYFEDSWVIFHIVRAGVDSEGIQKYVDWYVREFNEIDNVERLLIESRDITRKLVECRKSL